MSKWNGKRFSVYESEEKAVLGLIKDLGEQTNYNTDEVEKVKESNNKKVSHQEMQEKYKIDENANFTGTWFGFSKPAMTDVGLMYQVEKNTKDIETSKETIVSETNKLDIEMKALSSRIDNIISVGNGIDNAETVDVRVAKDGTIYNTAGQAVREQIGELNSYLEIEKVLGSGNIINSNSYFGVSAETVFNNFNSGAYYSDILPISGLVNIGNGVGLRCILEFTDTSITYNNINIQYLNSNKQVITYYQVWNAVNESFPVTGATYVRLMTNEAKYNEIKKQVIKSFALGFNITKGEKYSLTQNGKFDRMNNFIDDIEQLPINYDTVIRSINRIGYDVYNSNTPPQQSIESYKLAYKKGFRILLCDLRFTSDNVPVLHHDDIINSYAKMPNGEPLTEEISISNSTYSKLLEYDYGIYKGQEYKGTKIMHLKDMLKLCRMLGCEIYIEVKSMNEEQAKIACDLVRQYGISDKTSWSGTLAQMQYVINNIDTARVSTMPGIINDERINQLKTLQTGKNEVFFFAWDTTELTKDLVNKLIENNIKFEMGTLNSEEKIINYFAKDEIYIYCTGISSDKILSGKVLLKNQF